MYHVLVNKIPGDQAFMDTAISIAKTYPQCVGYKGHETLYTFVFEYEAVAEEFEKELWELAEAAGEKDNLFIGTNIFKGDLDSLEKLNSTLDS